MKKLFLFLCGLALCLGAGAKEQLLPEPVKTVTLAFGAASVRYYGTTKDYYIYAEREDYIIELDIYTDELVGTYAKSDFNLHYTALWTVNGLDTVMVSTKLFDAKAEITENAGLYNIAAELFMGDTVLYKMSMTYEKPLPDDTVRYTFAEPVLIDDYDNEWYFYASDDKYELNVDYYSKVITGQYSMTNGDFSEKYTILYLITGTDSTAVEAEDVKAVISEDETGYDILVEYFGNNKVYYIFTARCEKPKAENTVQVIDEAAQLSIYTIERVFRVVGVNEDKTVKLYVAVNSTKLEGEFAFADFNVPYSAAVIGDKQYQFVDGEAKSVLADNILTLEGWVLAKNNVKYEFRFKAAMSAEAIENTDAASNASKRIGNGIMFIEKAGVIYNAQGVRIR
jgi:outer membrane protein assembly factor BamE (lipoprotein component of BamABCDE complex)